MFVDPRRDEWPETARADASAAHAQPAGGRIRSVWIPSSTPTSSTSTSSRSLTAAGLEERAHASPTHLRCRGGSLLVVTVDYLSYSIYCKL